MSFDLGLTGRRALVTGGTKGIGAAVALALRDAGAEVLATARALPGQPVQGVRALGKFRDPRPCGQSQNFPPP